MKTIKKTFAELMEIDEIVGVLYTRNPLIRNGRFGYWYTKFYKKNITPITNEIAEKIADNRLDNAMIDKDTNEILYSEDKKSYRIDKEGQKKVNEFQRAIYKEYNEKEFDIIPQISSEVPVELLDEEKKVLKGLVI